MWSHANAGMDGTATGKGRGALGLSLVSVKARGKKRQKSILTMECVKSMEKHINHGV